MATGSHILAWKIPWTEEPGGPQSRGSQSQTRLSTHTHTHTHTWSEFITNFLKYFTKKYGFITWGEKSKDPVVLHIRVRIGEQYYSNDPRGLVSDSHGQSDVWVPSGTLTVTVAEGKGDPQTTVVLLPWSDTSLFHPHFTGQSQSTAWRYIIPLQEGPPEVTRVALLCWWTQGCGGQISYILHACFLHTVKI